VRKIPIARLASAAFVRALAVMVAAYVLGYGLMRALPEFGAGVLGLAASDAAVMERFRIEKDAPSSLADALSRLLRAKHGNTLNDRPVAEEIAMALRHSLPLFGASIALTALCAALGAFFGMRESRTSGWLARFLAFLPAYLPAYVAAGAIPLLGVVAARNEVTALLLVAALTAVIPGALLAGTIQASLTVSRQAPYYVTLLAHGYTGWVRFRLVAPTTFKQLLPMFARVVSGVIMVQVFVEAVLAYPGLGSSLLQAIRRTDINLVLGYVLLLSGIHASLVHMASIVRKASFGADQ